MTRVVLLVTSPRVPAGLLSADAWAALRTGPVFTDDPDLPLAVPLEAASISLETVDPTQPPVALARRIVDIATTEDTATWVVGPSGDQALTRAVMEAATESSAAGVAVDVEVLHGSWDPPGARLLDVVALMDRLRSPGGCPWDARQTHDSLAPYLLEEAYEAFQAIEDDDTDGLREELGDVLLQVVFHARLAEERGEGEAWSVDDVAAGLVDKLVRRHPHVFVEGHVSSPDGDLQADWDAIKTSERAGGSAVEGVPLAAPALTLAATLQHKAARLGVPAALIAPSLAAGGPPAAALAAAAAAVEDSPSLTAAGELLWTAVAMLRGLDLDAEAALRGRSKDFRTRLIEVESELAEDGLRPGALSDDQWREHFDSIDSVDAVDAVDAIEDAGR